MQPYYGLPALYLNALEHQSKQFIKLWFKPDLRISRKLKEASWIKYSKTYKCFVTYRSSQTIEQLHQHFSGIAQVNTIYLDRPKRLRPAQGTVVLADQGQVQPLEKKPQLEVIRLVPLLHEGKSLIQLSFQYNKQVYQALKELPACKWLKESRCFALEPGSEHLHQLLDKLQGLAQV